MVFYVNQKLISIRDKYTIKDEQGNDYCTVKGLFTIPSKFVVSDMGGKELFRIVQKIAIMPTFEVKEDGKQIARIRQKLALLRKRYEIEAPGGDCAINGDIMAWDFEITRGGKSIARISKKIVAIKDSYRIEVLDPADARLVLACVIVVDHCYHDNKH